jgi:hypothetical protein
MIARCCCRVSHTASLRTALSDERTVDGLVVFERDVATCRLGTIMMGDSAWASVKAGTTMRDVAATTPAGAGRAGRAREACGCPCCMAEETGRAI